MNAAKQKLEKILIIYNKSKKWKNKPKLSKYFNPKFYLNKEKYFFDKLVEQGLKCDCTGIKGNPPICSQGNLEKNICKNSFDSKEFTSFYLDKEYPVCISGVAKLYKNKRLDP